MIGPGTGTCSGQDFQTGAGLLSPSARMTRVLSNPYRAVKRRLHLEQYLCSGLQSLRREVEDRYMETVDKHEWANDRFEDAKADFGQDVSRYIIGGAQFHAKGGEGEQGDGKGAQGQA